MEVLINNKSTDCSSLAEFSQLLDRIDSLPNAEVWLFSPNGPSICLLKAESHTFLMYLRREGDHGFTSVGDGSREGKFQVRLANGQVDEYPLAWCLGPEFAYKGLAYFFVNAGEKSPYIQWRES
jgi:hypothetical protein